MLKLVAGLSANNNYLYDIPLYVVPTSKARTSLREAPLKGERVVIRLNKIRSVRSQLTFIQLFIGLSYLPAAQM